MKVILSGYSGAMGHVVRELAKSNGDITIVAGIDHKPDDSGTFPVVADPMAIDIEADVIIDFSHPSLLDGLIAFAKDRSLPIVVCTTGLDADQIAFLEEASKVIPIFRSGNMSFGIHLLQDILKQYTKLLADTYDIEIIEQHHRRKVDAPSGTALMLADTIADCLAEKPSYVLGRAGTSAKRSPGEIGIHAIRGGTIVGEHSVIFAGEDELIEIRHSAQSRRLFASGALKAAAFMSQAGPGLYTMTDVIQYFKEVNQ